MARDAIKSNGNVWFDARILAAMGNERLNSREGAAEAIGCSVDTIRRIETGLCKTMEVENAVLLSDLYNRPDLKNHYCLNECPIGRNRPISDDMEEIDRVAVKLTQILRKETVQGIKHKLQDIAADGKITDDEIKDFIEVVDELRELSRIISQVELLKDCRV